MNLNPRGCIPGAPIQKSLLRRRAVPIVSKKGLPKPDDPPASSTQVSQTDENVKSIDSLKTTESSHSKNEDIYCSGDHDSSLLSTPATTVQSEEQTDTFKAEKNEVHAQEQQKRDPSHATSDNKFGLKKRLLPNISHLKRVGETVKKDSSAKENITSNQKEPLELASISGNLQSLTLLDEPCITIRQGLDVSPGDSLPKTSLSPASSVVHEKEEKRLLQKRTKPLLVKPSSERRPKSVAGRASSNEASAAPQLPIPLAGNSVTDDAINTGLQTAATKPRAMHIQLSFGSLAKPYTPEEIKKKLNKYSDTHKCIDLGTISIFKNSGDITGFCNLVDGIIPISEANWKFVDASEMKDKMKSGMFSGVSKKRNESKNSDLCEESEGYKKLQLGIKLSSDNAEASKNTQEVVEDVPPSKLHKVKCGGTFSEICSAFKRKIKDITVDENSLVMKEFIAYTPDSEPMKPLSFKESQSIAVEENEEVGNPGPSGPRVIIKDGEIIVDPRTIKIKQTAHPEPVQPPQKSKPRSSDSWDLSSSMTFYRMLWKYGLDFSLLSSSFPERSRLSLKKKYNSEKKTNLKLIDYVMSGQCNDFREIMRELLILNHHQQIKKRPKIENAYNNYKSFARGRKRLNRPSASKKPSVKVKKKRSEVLHRLFHGDSSIEESDSCRDIEIKQPEKKMKIIKSTPPPDTDDSSVEVPLPEGAGIIKVSTNVSYSNLNIKGSVCINASENDQTADFNVTIKHD